MNLPARVLAALSLALLSACATGRDAVAVGAPQDLPAYDALIADEARLVAELPALEHAAAEAAVTPDPADDAPAQAALAKHVSTLERVELALAELEERGIRGQGAPFKDALPYGLGVLALEAGVALLSKRKRKLYVSAAKALGKGQVATMVGDVLKAYGAQHSTPQPTQTLYVNGSPTTDPFDNGHTATSSS